MEGLSLKNISKKYGEKKVLNNISMKISQGEIVGLIGRNGAGKTTLLNCIAGNIFPDSGSIFFEDRDLKEYPNIRKDFGVLIQPSFFEYMNTYDNLCLLQNAVGIWKKEEIKERIEKVLRIVGLEGKEKKYIRSFSFGMKQRLGFAQALLNGNKFMILDEPFVGLDINGREMVKKYLKELVRETNIGVIFSDHNLDEVKSLCDRIIVMKNGEKIYDNQLYEEHIYEIELEEVNNELIESIRGIQEEKIKVYNNIITIKGSRNLNDIIREISSKGKIIDIRNKENILENMLKED